MTVGELLELIKDTPHDTHVVIGGYVVAGAQVVNGRMREGYYGPIFSEAAKGKEKALMFLNHSEMSDGTFALLRV